MRAIALAIIANTLFFIGERMFLDGEEKLAGALYTLSIFSCIITVLLIIAGK